MPLRKHRVSITKAKFLRLYREHRTAHTFAEQVLYREHRTAHTFAEQVLYREHRTAHTFAEQVV